MWKATGDYDTPLDAQWTVNLAYSVAVMTSVTAPDRSLPHSVYETVIELIREPFQELALNLSIPSDDSLTLARALEFVAEIESELRRRGVRLAALFDFVWRIAVLLLAKDEPTHTSVEEQEVMHGVLRRSARNAGLLGDRVERLIGSISHDALPGEERSQTLTEFLNWIQDEVQPQPSSSNTAPRMIRSVGQSERGHPPTTQRRQDVSNGGMATREAVIPMDPDYESDRRSYQLRLTWDQIELKKNNFWYAYGPSDAVIVFVHGIFSDSKGCWHHSEKGNPARDLYWPDLILDDPRFRTPSIFMGGFYTGIDAGRYEIKNAAEELFSAMKRVDAEGREAPIDRRSIVFVCHSTGGVVARYLLERHEEDFKDKQLVGLVLIASPSYGAKMADRLKPLSDLYNQSLGAQLEWGHWSLRDLDGRFKDMVNERDKHIPNLRGVEGYENHFVLHRKLLPDKVVLVGVESAGRYFGEPKLLRDTDHFSSVKPDGWDHPAHQMLVDFWQDHLGSSNSPTISRTSEVGAMDTTDDSSWRDPAGLDTRASVQSDAGGADVEIVSASRETLKFTVETTYNGMRWSATVPLDAAIGQVVRAIVHRIGIGTDSSGLPLVFKMAAEDGRILDDRKTVRQIGLLPDEVVHLILQQMQAG